MKKIISLIMIMMLLTSCSSNAEANSSNMENEYPYILYQHSMWTIDEDNRKINIQDGYILNQGHSYDVVETEDGYDIVLHFVRE